MDFDKIYCMDNVAGMQKYLADGSVDLTVTSPPYDNQRTYENDLDWDFESVAKELYRVTKNGGVVVWIVNDAVINKSESGTSFRQALYFKEIGFNLHDTMIWQKSGCTHPDSTRYHQNFEFMFVFSKGKIATVNLIADKPNSHRGRVSGRHRLKDGSLALKKHLNNLQIRPVGVRYNIWKISTGFRNVTKDPIAYEHPAIFPEALARDHILSWSNEGDLVLDPFMGSGTVAIAAIDTNRKYIGFDCIQKYCDVAEQRIKNKRATD